MAAKKELVAKVVGGDITACVQLIEDCKVPSLERLVAVCFADMNPSAEEFDVLADAWACVQVIERNRANG